MTDHVLEQACAQRLIPVVVIDDLAAVAPLQNALVEARARVIEVTLRTDAAEHAIAQLSENGSLLVGAGTVVSPPQVDAAKRAGARFVVSPGFSESVIERCREQEMPVIPGVATPTDVMRALAADLTLLKLFPAQASGGTEMLRALHGPFPGVRFVPTGGISESNAPEYLRLPYVAAIGGSWMVAPTLISARDFDAIRRHTIDALALVGNA